MFFDKKENAIFWIKNHVNFSLFYITKSCHGIFYICFEGSEETDDEGFLFMLKLLNRNRFFDIIMQIVKINPKTNSSMMINTQTKMNKSYVYGYTANLFNFCFFFF